MEHLDYRSREDVHCMVHGMSKR